MRRRWGRISLLALVLFGFLLGHDALMAANPHEQEPVTHTHAAEIPMVTTCPMPDAAQHVSPHLPQLDTVDVAVAIDRPLHIVPGESRMRWEIPPAYPPDVLRALLQVFLN